LPIVDRRLTQPKILNRQSTLRVVFDASREIRSSIVFGTAVVILSFLPLFALSGVEGRLFTPLGFAYIVSILASFMVSMTVTPVLSYYLLPQSSATHREGDGFLLAGLKKLVTPLIRLSMAMPTTLLILTWIAVAIAGWQMSRLGRNFLPPFDEGSVQVNVTLPPGSSLGASNQVSGSIVASDRAQRGLVVGHHQAQRSRTWTYYYLYVILDIYSRCVVGWMLADCESADLAKQLIQTTIDKQNIPPEQLIIHSDRGPSMTSHSVAQLLGSLGVTKSHSRPHVSNDNPFSESQFKTMKYRPEFPKRFGCYEDGLEFCRKFFHWYNNDHYHSGIGLLTPTSLHYGRAEEITAARRETLHQAWEKTPERFVHGIPKPARVPQAVWINPPKPIIETKKEAPEANCPGASEETSLTHPRSDYPSDGCVPAEPSSVSPDEPTLSPKTSLNTGAMPRKIPGVRGLAPEYTGINC